MAGLVDQVYQASPMWAQQLTVSAYGWWWYKRRFGPRFHELVAGFAARDRWSAAQFRTYQATQLRAIFDAARRSTYYKPIFADAGWHGAMDPFEVLERLPLLSKETLRTRAGDLLTSAPPKGTIAFKSSGTTGTPTAIYYTRDFHPLELAVAEARNLRWAGVDFRERRVMFGVRKVCRYEQQQPPFWRFSPAENMAYASVYHLSQEHLPAYLAFLRQYRPSVVMGYPSALNTLASYALEHGDPPPAARGVFTTSETVTESARRAIEAAFQSRIYDRYCAVEMCLFASQCEHGRYHVSPDLGIVEILDSEGRPAAKGELGEVVCTGLHNLLQPLIRYRIGDVARWAVDQDCPCGRAMPVLEAIEGRFEDVCVTPDGRHVVRFDTVFKGVDVIREAQVVQESDGRFIIQVVPADGFGDREVEILQHNMRQHVGDAPSTVRLVEAIPRMASGKFRAVICNLSPDDARRLKRSGLSQ